MSDSGPVTPDSQGGARRFSDQWLAIALVATVLVVVLAAVAISELTASLTGSDAQDELTYTPDPGSLVAVVARTPGGASEWSSFARVVSYLSEEIGRPVIARYLTSEDQATEIVREEQADMAFLCAHMYLDLMDEGLVEGVCVPVIEGQSETVMQLVVRADDADHRTLGSLAGQTIAVSDKSSLGGQAFLLWLCGENGIDSQSFFGEVRVGQTMHENLEALLEGEIDATVVTTVQLSEVEKESIYPIISSPALGSPPVVVSTRMDDGLKEQVVEALLRFEAHEVLSENAALDGFDDIATVSYEFEQELRYQCELHGHSD